MCMGASIEEQCCGRENKGGKTAKNVQEDSGKYTGWKIATSTYVLSVRDVDLYSHTDSFKQQLTINELQM